MGPFQTDHKNVLVLGTCQMLSGTGRGLFMVTSPAVALGIGPHADVYGPQPGIVEIPKFLTRY